MNKKIKVVDIFKMIAKGEEVPKKIKCIDREFYFQENETIIDYLYRTDKNGNGWLVVQDIGLNDEIEILEDNTEEIEELKETDYSLSFVEEKFFNKINELVKAVNELRKEKSNE